MRAGAATKWVKNYVSSQSPRQEKLGRVNLNSDQLSKSGDCTQNTPRRVNECNQDVTPITSRQHKISWRFSVTAQT